MIQVSACSIPALAEAYSRLEALVPAGQAPLVVGPVQLVQLVQQLLLGPSRHSLETCHAMKGCLVCQKVVPV